MGKHSADRAPDRSTSARPRLLRTRLLLALGVLIAPAGVGTMAYWTDTATIKSGVIESGTLDLTVGADAAGAVQLPGQGGTFEYSQLTIGNLVPGESIARPFAVKNSGSVGFTFNATVATADNALTSAGSGLQMQIFQGGTPTNTGAESSGNRAGTCPDGTSVMAEGAVTTSPRQVHATAQTLTPSSTRSYCAIIKLHGDSPNALQGKGTSLVIALDATQFGAP